MIPKLHAKGTSFKGAAAYLLHDKDGAATSGRVAWVETVNLLTAEPDIAWRVMAATAIDANRLKEQAGVKRSGRQSKDVVLHLTLSWSPEQKPTRAEMSDFARRAIQALKAEDRQAMIICHTDEQQPHLHILLNRVSPKDGRLLSSSNDWRALSALALAHEQEDGKIYCQKRAHNAAKRKRGERARGTKDIPRPEFEALRAAEKEALAEIPIQVVRQHPQAGLQLRAEMRAQLRDRLKAIKTQLRPDWRALYERQRQETRQAREEKASFIGRLKELIGKSKAGSPALSFRQRSGAPSSWDDRGRQQKQRQERTRLARNYQDEVRKAIGEIRTACQIGVRQLFIPHDRGGPAKQFAPAASGIAPQPQQTDQTAAQRRLSELAAKFRKDSSSRQPEPKTPVPGKPRDKDRDRDREPEL